MRFGLLGPLTVHDGSAERVVNGVKLRTLLAVLLLAADRPVPLDTLKAALWGERPPASAKASIHNMISRLRGLLDDEPGTRLRLTPNGYLLRAGVEEVDARVFDQHLSQGRAALHGQDWTSLHRQATAALALWRGTPLAELPDLEQARAPREHWQEAQLQAVEWRIQAELELGRSSGLVPELTRLVAEHPLHEAFHGLLMLTLHQLGQSAEALAVFQRLRRALVAELAIEPGPRLQQIHQRVLRGEAAAPATRRGPAQLRSAPAYFVGRTEQLAALRAALIDPPAGAAVALISGMAGIGKTALALRVAESLREQFPDGQLFLNLRGAGSGLAPLPAQLALGTLLTDLGVGAGRIPEEPEAAAALLRSELAGSRTLLVLDDAASAAQVRPLLPAGPGCAALVTSRAALTTLDSATHVRLHPLTAAESLALVHRASRRSSAEIDSAAGARLVELCGRLPLALRIATARLAARAALPLELLVDQLTSQQSRLDQLELDDLSVRQSLAVAWLALQDSARACDRSAALALRRIGALRLPEYSAPVLAELMAVPAPEADSALNRLAEIALLDEVRLGHFAPHDLVRVYAQELAAQYDAPTERAAARERVLRRYAEAACAAALLLFPEEQARRQLPEVPDPARFADSEAALAWWDEHWPNLPALAEHVRRYPEDAADFLVLTRAISCYLQQRGRLQELHLLNRAALELARARGDRFAEASAQHDLAGTYYAAGRWVLALSRQEAALTGWRELGATQHVQRSLSNLGMLLGNLSRDDEAIARLEEALALSRDSGDAFTEAITLSHLGNAAEKADPLRALDYHRQSIEVGERTASPKLFRSVGQCNIGYAYLTLDQPELALAQFERVLHMHYWEQRWTSERQVRVGRIRALRVLGRLEECERACHEYLADQPEDRFGCGLVRHQFGLLLQAQGDRAGALAQWRSARTDLADHDPALRAELDALLASQAGELGLGVG